MAERISLLLDKAKSMHRLSSDYKLALVMGVSHNSLASYRAGKTLPDARVISLLCDLTGDDPALLAVEMEEQRAKTDEARALWHQIATRLQNAAAAGVLSVLFVVGGMGTFGNEAMAKSSGVENFSSYTSWNFIRRLFRALAPAVIGYLRGLKKGRNHVFGTTSTAAA
jgi:transcriptional regulator with XRE-family HTH domain